MTNDLSVRTSDGKQHVIRGIKEIEINGHTYYHLLCPNCNYDWWDSDAVSNTCPRCKNIINKEVNKE